jgi:hypothetical protein
VSVTQTGTLNRTRFSQFNEITKKKKNSENPPGRTVMNIAREKILEKKT